MLAIVATGSPAQSVSGIFICILVLVYKGGNIVAIIKAVLSETYLLWW